MASSPLSSSLSLILFLLCACATSSATPFGGGGGPLLPESTFSDALRNTISAVATVSSVVSNIFNPVVDNRLRVALSDCLDLLDYTTDKLNMSLTTSQTGNDEATGSVKDDLATWLSAALAYPDTCLQGFDGSSSTVRALVAGSLNQVNPLVTQLLKSVQPTVRSPPAAAPKRLPSWLHPRDQKLLAAKKLTPDVVVALDGTGNFTKIMDAIEQAPDYHMGRYVIFLKNGVYLENVELHKKKWGITIVGEDTDNTVITGNRNFVDGWTTFRSATLAVSGRRFMMMKVTVRNTAGPEKHQAVAFRCDSDLSVMYQCKFEGFQDTLYTHTMRQFYKDCEIQGTVDFVFGDAAAVFQDCTLVARQGLPNQKNTVTAQGRKVSFETTGFTFQFCNFTAEPGLKNTTETYLGRPWKEYSRTMVLQSMLTSAISPRGWLMWNETYAVNTTFYGEYMNYGPSSDMTQRLNWTAIKALDASQAAQFTVDQFIQGSRWLHEAGIAYVAGLSR